MKQLIQSLDMGELSVEDIPAPQPNKVLVLVRTTKSAISPGTETSLVEFGNANWLERAKNHPEHVQKTIDKMGQVGLPETVKAIRRRLERPLALGYSSSGIVLSSGNSGLAKGTRVAAIGPHAGRALVGSNFVCPLPEHVSDKAGAFTALGCVALHAVRETSPAIGETIAVLGLGILGQITMQILRANGCKVYGIEPIAKRRKKSKSLGFNVTSKASNLPESQFDAVIIAASARDSSPIKSASRLCKKRGRIVLLGTADIQISRRLFFEKELSFCVSRSMGTGRYDYDFETGQDYPEDVVRWDVQKNMRTFLDLVDQGQVRIEPLIDKEVEIENAPEVYREFSGKNPPLGVLITYDVSDNSTKKKSKSYEPENSGAPRVSILGAGNFVFSTLAPALAGQDIIRDHVVSLRGLNAKILADKYGFRSAEGDPSIVFESSSNAIIIATQHETHADLSIETLKHGKHLFVEKPIATNLSDIKRIEEKFYAMRRKFKKHIVFTAGFNRRFAPAIVQTKNLLDELDPRLKRSFVYTINAPQLPDDHWLLDSKRGGGIFIGEACHFVDLLRFLSGAKVVEFHGIQSDATNGSLHLKYENGDVGTIIYTTRGGDNGPKEDLKIFVNQSIFSVHNCLKLNIVSNAEGLRALMKPRRFTHRSKGHAELLSAFFSAFKNGTQPIPVESIFESHRIALAWQNGS